MMDNLLDKIVVVTIDEPDVAQPVLRGHVSGEVKIDSLPYLTIATEEGRTWLAIRPRHKGDTFVSMLTGHEVIANIGRPTDPRMEIPPSGASVDLRQVEFVGIGSIKLVDL